VVLVDYCVRGDSPGVTTNGRTATLEVANARFLENWHKRCGGFVCRKGTFIRWPR
jgi:hypothetical protein